MPNSGYHHSYTTNRRRGSLDLNVERSPASPTSMPNSGYHRAYTTNRRRGSLDSNVEKSPASPTSLQYFKNAQSMPNSGYHHAYTTNSRRGSLDSNVERISMNEATFGHKRPQIDRKLKLNKSHVKRHPSLRVHPQPQYFKTTERRKECARRPGQGYIHTTTPSDILIKNSSEHPCHLPSERGDTHNIVSCMRGRQYCTRHTGGRPEQPLLKAFPFNGHRSPAVRFAPETTHYSKKMEMEHELQYYRHSDHPEHPLFGTLQFDGHWTVTFAPETIYFSKRVGMEHGQQFRRPSDRPQKPLLKNLPLAEYAMEMEKSCGKGKHTLGQGPCPAHSHSTSPDTSVQHEHLYYPLAMLQQQTIETGHLHSSGSKANRAFTQRERPLSFYLSSLPTPLQSQRPVPQELQQQVPTAIASINRSVENGNIYAFSRERQHQSYPPNSGSDLSQKQPVSSSQLEQQEIAEVRGMDSSGKGANCAFRQYDECPPCFSISRSLAPLFKQRALPQIQHCPEEMGGINSSAEKCHAYSFRQRQHQSYPPRSRLVPLYKQRSAPQLQQQATKIGDMDSRGKRVFRQREPPSCPPTNTSTSAASLQEQRSAPQLQEQPKDKGDMVGRGELSNSRAHQRQGQRQSSWHPPPSSFEATAPLQKQRSAHDQQGKVPGAHVSISNCEEPCPPQPSEAPRRGGKELWSIGRSQDKNRKVIPVTSSKSQKSSTVISSRGGIFGRKKQQPRV